MNDQARAEIGHRFAPRAAGVIVEAWAPTRSECLEELEAVPCGFLCRGRATGSRARSDPDRRAR
jgi:hypothetical protein